MAEQVDAKDSKSFTRSGVWVRFPLSVPILIERKQNMSTAEAIILLIMLIELGYSAGAHGKSRGNYNFLASLINFVLVIWLMRWAGLFQDIF